MAVIKEIAFRFIGGFLAGLVGGVVGGILFGLELTIISFVDSGELLWEFVFTSVIFGSVSGSLTGSIVGIMFSPRHKFLFWIALVLGAIAILIPSLLLLSPVSLGLGTTLVIVAILAGAISGMIAYRFYNWLPIPIE